MESAIKNFLYAGVGLASLTAEKLQKSIDKLIEENKISTGEGKKILDEFFKKTENKKKEFEKQLKKITEEVVNKVQLPKKKDIESLEKRIAALEAKVRKLSKSRTNSKNLKPYQKFRISVKSIDFVKNARSIIIFDLAFLFDLVCIY